LEILLIDWLMVISSILPDVRLFSVSGIRPDIWQVKSGLLADIKKGRIIRPARYPAHPLYKPKPNSRRLIKQFCWTYVAKS
jgi:hypothetical protein